MTEDKYETDALDAAYFADDMDDKDEALQKFVEDYYEMQEESDEPLTQEEEDEQYEMALREAETAQLELEALRARGVEQRHQFANAIRHYMYVYDRNQTDVAKACGVSTASVSTWCAGKKMPRPEKLLRLADYFGVPYTDILSAPSEESIARSEAAKHDLSNELDALLLKIKRSTKPLKYGDKELPRDLVDILKHTLYMIKTVDFH